MPTARVGNVKAADPGLGFSLNFDQVLNNTLKVVITMTDLQQNQKYQSEVTLFNPISDHGLVFVVPFGDNVYAPSNCLSFKLDLYWPYDASSPNETLTGVVMGENGVFNFSTSVPTVKLIPKTGDMLQSEDGAFIGVYQKDGNFCVYPQFADHQSNLNPVYSTNTPVGSPTSFGFNQGGQQEGMYVTIKDSSGQSIAITTTPFPDTGGAYNFSINHDGTLCINGLVASFINC